MQHDLYKYAYVKQLNGLVHRLNLGRVVLGRAYRGLTGGFLLLRNFSVAISARNLPRKPNN